MTIWRRLRFVAVPVSAGVLAVAVLLSRQPAASLALDPRATECGYSVQGQIQAQFALDRAMDYHTYLPKMLRAPELETNEPAFVVVYAGNSRVGGLSVAPPPLDGTGGAVVSESVPTTYSGVVCVVTSTGPTIYFNVDTSS
ncbi:MAG TPA: hypothetical protein VGS60_17585 [Actinomycetes bacterium]|nr:hypothetical protein [Actinomycetes bacterium]